MRVKLLLALAIASVLLIFSTGMALAQDCGCGIPASLAGPTADQLTRNAVDDISAFGFPDLSCVGVPQDTIDATGLPVPACGVCGDCPECTCTETTTVIPGPEVNLGCPTLTLCPVQVDLVSPTITGNFAPINVAPQAILNVPQVNAQLNCFDIACLPVTNINSCLPCEVDC